jgi:hypothetical protein
MGQESGRPNIVVQVFPAAWRLEYGELFPVNLGTWDGPVRALSLDLSDCSSNRPPSHSRLSHFDRPSEKLRKTLYFDGLGMPAVSRVSFSLSRPRDHRGGLNRPRAHSYSELLESIF